MRPFERTRFVLTCITAVILLVVGFQTVASAAGGWKGEFVNDVAAFRYFARSKASLVNHPPMFGYEFQEINAYSGELRAEARQLGWLKPPASCLAVQQEAVKLLGRMSHHAHGLGDYKDLTPIEFERSSKLLLTLPSQLTSVIRKARRC
jgi:hypothetical protein